MLEFRSVGKAFGARWVLRHLDLFVGGGETVAIVGPNGSGKTTLLRIAATMSRPTEGELLFQGHDAVRHPERTRSEIGVVLHDPPVYDELTAAEHLAWWARVRGEPESATGLADAFGLATASRPARTLSRGQRQRLALAMATLGAPRLLVLDEPFTALDAAGHRTLERVLRQRSESAATLLSLHDRALAHRIADRVLKLRDGRLVPA